MGATITLTALYEPVENGWVQAYLRELPEVITAAPSEGELRDMLDDALGEYLATFDRPPMVRGRPLRRAQAKIRLRAANGNGVYERVSVGREGQIVSRANDSDRYVQPNNRRGGWDIVKERHQRASAHTRTKAEAINRARQIVRNQGGGEIRIKNQQGRLIDSDTVSGPRHRESRARDRK